ncbi:MAG: hypothetical protein AB8B60_11855 [Sulfitobacter sp.]
MSRLLANPNPRMQSMLAGPLAQRNAAVSRFNRIRDAHFGIGPNRMPRGLRGLRGLSRGAGFGDAVMEGLTPMLRTQVMLNEWERASAASRAYQGQIRRAAATEYWAQRRETAQTQYREMIDGSTCGADQECRMRAARQQYGTRLPASGTWSGQPGNSVWTPAAGTEARQALDETNAARTAAGRSPLQGVRYRNGFPEFRPFSSANVPIPNMQGNLRTGPTGDVGQARRILGDRWSPGMEEGRTWHHHQNTRNLLAVDSRIHNATIRDAPTGRWLATGGALHTGGASATRDPLF